MSYDPKAVLAAADAHTLPIVLLAAFTIVSIYVCFGEAIRLGFKHKTYALPAAANFYFLAHDFTFGGLFHHWFYEVDHWFVKLFWCALIPAAIMEAVMLYQTIRYGRQELLPTVSQPTFALLMIGAQLMLFVVFWIVKASMDDDLFLINYAVTVFWLMPFTIPLVARRGSQRGQSALFTWGALGIAVGFWPLTLYLDPYFASPLFVGLGIVTIVWGVANLMLLRRFPAGPPIVPSRSSTLSPKQ